MKNSLLAIWKMSRPLNLFIILLLFYVFRYTIVKLFIGEQTLLSDLAFFLVALSTTFIAAGGYIINDYFDRHIDAVNRPHRLIVGRQINSLTTIQAHFFFSFGGVLLGAMVAFIYEIYSLVVIQIICVFILFYYSLRLKNHGIWGNLTVSLLVAVVPIVAGIYEFLNPYMELPMFIIIGFSVFAFLFTFIREIVKDFEDIEGDLKYGRRTLPGVWGIKRTKHMISVLILLGIGLMGYIQYYTIFLGGNITIYYFLFLLQIPSLLLIILIYRAKNRKQYHFCSNLIKVILLFGILYGITLYFYF